MIGIHVLDDFRGGVQQGIGAGAFIVLGGNPPHNAETADEVHSRDFQPVIREVGEVLPELCVLVAREVKPANLRGGDLGEPANGADGPPA